MKKRLTAIVLMLAFFTTGALAATSYKKSIEVEYGISLFINGREATLADVNGNTVLPFVHNGTTYVPIRAISERLGGSISYDKSSNQAVIWDSAAIYSKLTVNLAVQMDSLMVQAMFLDEQFFYDVIKYDEELGASIRNNAKTSADSLTSFAANTKYSAESQQFSKYMNAMAANYDTMLACYKKGRTSESNIRAFSAAYSALLEARADLATALTNFNVLDQR